MQEREIVAWIRERDERGMEALLLHYGPLMRYIIAPILSNVQDREECLSETAMRVWDKIDQYEPKRGSWRAWLTAITRNIALNYLRQGKKADATQELTPELSSAEPTPEEVFVQLERSKAVKRAINELSTGERALFYRKYYYLQSTAQIASELGITERAVEGRLYRIKKLLRNQLGGEGYEQF